MNRYEKRSKLIDDLNDASNGELTSMEEALDKCWIESFKKIGGAKISNFTGALKAGEIVINETDKDLIFPRLKPIWEKGIEKATSCYIIVVDGLIAKIGALKSGVKSSSFSQYLTGVAGSPSRRSSVVYLFMLSMLAHGSKIEIYHVTMGGVANIDIPTIDGFVNADIHYSHYDIEHQNLNVYKKATNGHIPLLNFKERNATVPKAFDAIYDVIHKKTSKNKKYTYTAETTEEDMVVVKTEKVTV